MKISEAETWSNYFFIFSVYLLGDRYYYNYNWWVCYEGHPSPVLNRVIFYFYFCWPWSCRILATFDLKLQLQSSSFSRRVRLRRWIRLVSKTIQRNRLDYSYCTPFKFQVDRLRPVLRNTLTQRTLIQSGFPVPQEARGATIQNHDKKENGL